MSIGRLLLLISGTVAILLGSGAQTEPASDRAETIPIEQRILVMVRLAPEHFRPGSYGSPYGDQQGQSERSRVAREIARKYGLKLVDNWPMPMIGIDCFVMAVPRGLSPEAAAGEVSRDPKVSWAQPVGVYTARGVLTGHNDPLYAAEPAAAEARA